MTRVIICRPDMDSPARKTAGLTIDTHAFANHYNPNRRSPQFSSQEPMLRPGQVYALPKLPKMEALSTQIESVSSMPYFQQKDQPRRNVLDSQGTPKKQERVMASMENRRKDKKRKGSSPRRHNKTSKKSRKNDANSSFKIHMDPRRNFLFLKQSDDMETRPNTKDDFKDTTDMFGGFEELNLLNSTNRESRSRWKRLESMKPLHNYTIYDDNYQMEAPPFQPQPYIGEVRPYDSIAAKSGYENVNLEDREEVTSMSNASIGFRPSYRSRKDGFSTKRRHSRKDSQGGQSKECYRYTGRKLNRTIDEQVENLNRQRTLKRAHQTSMFVEPVNRSGLRPLKHKILKILDRENLKAKNSNHSSFFGKYTVRKFLESQPEVKNSAVSMQLMEEELADAKSRKNIRTHFSTRLLQQGIAEERHTLESQGGRDAFNMTNPNFYSRKLISAQTDRFQEDRPSHQLCMKKTESQKSGVFMNRVISTAAGRFHQLIQSQSTPSHALSTYL